MKQIDEQRLEEDLAYRFDYLKEFLEFGDEDVAAIRSLVGHLAPRVDAMVERTYDKLLAFDATARHFVAPGTNDKGPLAQAVNELGPEHEQIRFRKSHLRTYLMNLLGKAYDPSMAKYLDTVGKMHTPRGGSSAINVPQAQMNVFMGMLSIIFIDEIAALGLNRDQEVRAIKAFTRLTWIQNDFINKHYGEHS